MSVPLNEKNTLVSVIIPCFNHAQYLPKAVQSVLQQDYPAIEVVVVDDGSTDNTRTVANGMAGVKYVYQNNAGLSAARNTGIRESTGAFLVFLDADDWLLPHAIRTNVEWLMAHPDAAFVSGNHTKVYTNSGLVQLQEAEVADNHYLHFLQGNYIAMIAAVMFRRRVFDEFLYDTTLKACEDYDLYLKVARKYPVLHHNGNMAAYRLHAHNMSNKIPMMLRLAHLVLNRQKEHLRTPEEHAALNRGLHLWSEVYYQELYNHLWSHLRQGNTTTFFFLLRNKPWLILESFMSKTSSMFKSFLKKNTPAVTKRLLYKMSGKEYRPSPGKVNPGDFFRLGPFSTAFGYDRGGPVDRVYIEQFLRQESNSIKGRVLEIGDNEYTLKFGGEGVQKSDILHVDKTNTKATFIGDLSNAPQVPDDTFDCVILTQTLHLIYDFKGALATCHRILKPGGTLLLTSPGITPIDHGEWKNIWYWSFTDKSLQKLTDEAFPNGNVAVQTFGNVYVATAFLYGMGSTEIAADLYAHNDPHFQVIITVKATKASAL